MALERVPADIRKEGGVARMAQISVIEAIQRTVSIPVMAKVRIGHFVEAQVLDALGVDFIDESEVLTPADETYHVDKHGFRSPFVCGARNLGEALRRISEGAAMIRTKGEAGSGNIVEAVRHLRQVNGDIRAIQALRGDELATRAKELGAPIELVRYVHAAREAAGAELRRGRHRHAGRRRALHEPRRRGRVRGLGHLQERRPRGARPRGGARHHALEGAGGGARSLARARRGDGGHRDLDDPRERAARESRLVEETAEPAMYVPDHFAERELAVLHGWLRRFPFALLVTAAGGDFEATHLPFWLDAERGPQGTLYGHVARANPHWRCLDGATRALAVFSGPHAYVSPRWYERPSVPTWNYLAVHAEGVPRRDRRRRRGAASCSQRLTDVYEGEGGFAALPQRPGRRASRAASSPSSCRSSGSPARRSFRRTRRPAIAPA